MLQNKIARAAVAVVAIVGMSSLQTPALASRPPVVPSPDTGESVTVAEGVDASDPAIPPDEVLGPEVTGESAVASDTRPTTRLLVRMDVDSTATDEAEMLEELDAVDHEELTGDWVAVETDEPVTARDAERQARDENVVDVEEDALLWAPSAHPNDYHYASQWGFHPGWGSNAQTAWNTTIGHGSVIVAVVDTGVHIHHPDLSPNIWLNTDEVVNGYDDDHNGYIDDLNGWDFVNWDNTVYDGSSDAHGTHVAGTIGAKTNNGMGVAGMNWQVQVMPLKFIGSGGVGYTSDAIRAIQYAVANGAKVINASWGGGSYSASLRSAISAAANAGVMFVAAAGNSAKNIDQTSYYPVGYGLPNMIGVAALTPSGARASFSNYGPGSVHLAAPGQTILSTLPGGYGYYSGTSMATPHVAGAAALLWAADPGASMSEVRSAILNSAAYTPGVHGLVQTNGRLDVASGLGMLGYRAYGGFRGGVYVGGGDVLGDSSDEIIVGADSGGGPHVQVLDENGSTLTGFYAYGGGFIGGVRVAAGDVDGDGKDEIITGAGPGGSPHVRVFEANGSEHCGMFAYSTSFHGGVYVAAGDVDGDGKDEVITGAGAGGSPHVVVFDGCTPKTGFFAYAGNFHGGVRVGAGDIMNGGKDEIVTGAGPGGGPHVRVVDGNGSGLSSFPAYGEAFYGGVYVSANEEHDFIVTGAGEPYVHVRTVTPTGGPRSDFAMTDPGGVYGVRVGTGTFDVGDPGLVLTGGPPSASFVGLRADDGGQISPLFG